MGETEVGDDVNVTEVEEDISDVEVVEEPGTTKLFPVELELMVTAEIAPDEALVKLDMIEDRKLVSVTKRFFTESCESIFGF